MIQDTGLRIQDTGFRIQGSGYRAQDTGLRDLASCILHLASCILLAFCILVPSSALASGAKGLQHMGPTGIYGYITSKRAFTVKSVDKGSPADGKIWPGDQVTGAGRVPFLKRVRFEFGADIAEARTEKNKGKLVLMVRRKAGGRKMQRVTLQLAVVGPDTFGDTAPYNDAKTDALITEAAEYLVANGRVKGGGDANSVVLGLLATGEEKYIKTVRDIMHREKQPADTNALVNKGGGYTSWRWGAKILGLTEYYLLTGDKYVLPAIRMYAEGLASGQDAAGLWGHQMKSQRTGRAHGYGQMNQPTMPVFIGLALARKCGIDSPRIKEAVRRSTAHYVHNYVNKGSLGYGNHGPNSKGYNNNGTSGSLAIALAAAGHVEGAKFFARMSMAAYNNLESGHVAHSWNLMWTGLGANIGGPEASAAFFKKTSWLYPMKVDWRGGYTYEDKKPTGSDTGAYLLNLCAGRRKIHLTGKGVDPKNFLSKKEAEETINIHKFMNKLIPMDPKQLMAVIDTHWSPAVRRAAEWKLLKFKREDLLPLVKQRLKAKRGPTAVVGAGRFWDPNPEVLDEVAAIMTDRSNALDLRCAAANVLGSCAWARYVDPAEDFTRSNCDYNELSKPAHKYFDALVKVVVEEKKDDPWDELDAAAGGAMASFGDPYHRNLIADKQLYYKAINKLLAHKHSSGVRNGAMKLLAVQMPIEDFHYVADMVMHAGESNDRSWTQYRGNECATVAISMLDRLNIQEAVELCIDSFPSKTRGKERIAHLSLFGKFAANAKPYLPKLKAALEEAQKGAEAAAEGETKDTPLTPDMVKTLIEEIEKAENPRKMISLEEAIKMGKE
jgi:hypothetical protein